MIIRKAKMSVTYILELQKKIRELESKLEIMKKETHGICAFCKHNKDLPGEDCVCNKCYRGSKP